MSEETIINEEKTYTDPETGKFVKGNPGGGRPKGSISVVSAIKKKLEECPEGKEKTYLHYLVEKIMKKAIVDDDVSMIKDIINRVDGMPKESVDVKYEEVKPIYAGKSKSIQGYHSDQEDILTKEEN